MAGEKKDMTISMERALEESREPHKLGELGFMITVLRDNTSDDYVHEVLDNLLKNCTDFK